MPAGNPYGNINQPPPLTPISGLAPGSVAGGTPSATIPSLNAQDTLNNPNISAPSADTAAGASSTLGNLDNSLTNSLVAGGIGAGAGALLSSQTGNLAKEMLGPGGAELLSNSQYLSTTGTNQINAGISGNLTPAQQSVVSSYMQSQQAAARSTLAQAGLTGSSAEFQTNQYIQAQAANLQNNFAQTDISQGIQMLQLGDSAAAEYMNANYKANVDIQQTIAKAVGSISSLLGSSGGLSALFGGSSNGGAAATGDSLSGADEAGFQDAISSGGGDDAIDALNAGDNGSSFLGLGNIGSDLSDLGSAAIAALSF